MDEIINVVKTSYGLQLEKLLTSVTIEAVHAGSVRTLVTIEAVHAGSQTTQ